MGKSKNKSKRDSSSMKKYLPSVFSAPKSATPAQNEPQDVTTTTTNNNNNDKDKSSESNMLEPSVLSSAFGNVMNTESQSPVVQEPPVDKQEETPNTEITDSKTSPPSYTERLTSLNSNKGTSPPSNTNNNNNNNNSGSIRNGTTPSLQPSKEDLIRHRLLPGIASLIMPHCCLYILTAVEGNWSQTEYGPISPRITKPVGYVIGNAIPLALEFASALFYTFRTIPALEKWVSQSTIVLTHIFINLVVGSVTLGIAIAYNRDPGFNNYYVTPEFICMYTGSALAYLQSFLLAVDYLTTSKYNSRGSGLSPSMQAAGGIAALVNIWAGFGGLIYSNVEDKRVFHAFNSCFESWNLLTGTGISNTPIRTDSSKVFNLFWLPFGYLIIFGYATTIVYGTIGYFDGPFVRRRLEARKQMRLYLRSIRNSAATTIAITTGSSSSISGAAVGGKDFIRKCGGDNISSSGSTGSNTPYDTAQPNYNNSNNQTKDCSDNNTTAITAVAYSKPDTDYQITKQHRRFYLLLFGIFLLVKVTSWLLGSLIFHFTEDNWSYWESMYFTFLAILGIGLSGRSPSSPSGQVLYMCYTYCDLILTFIFVAIMANLAWNLISWFEGFKSVGAFFLRHGPKKFRPKPVDADGVELDDVSTNEHVDDDDNDDDHGKEEEERVSATATEGRGGEGSKGVTIRQSNSSSPTTSNATATTPTKDPTTNGELYNPSTSVFTQGYPQTMDRSFIKATSKSLNETLGLANRIYHTLNEQKDGNNNDSNNDSQALREQLALLVGRLESTIDDIDSSLL
ncbi:Potassium channel [Mycoemilia scoparia]|uniref:Potassium channel n=1 Tax=Mycoemilia scoparia TaxID=417184 RepID=A0A9W8A268_9FUNG|nr:Potassium channel [Mycoemilia scoparia]